MSAVERRIVVETETFPGAVTSREISNHDTRAQARAAARVYRTEGVGS